MKQSASLRYLKSLRRIFMLVSVCFLIGCEIFDEPETCRYTTDAHAVWQPYMGITGFLANPDAGKSGWYMAMPTESRMYRIDNVCPNAPFHLEVTVKQLTLDEPYRALGFVVEVGYEYGQKFSNYYRYPMPKISQETWNKKIVGIPDLLGILGTASTVFVTVWAEVPYTGNENAEIAENWARNFIYQMEFKVAYTRYK